MPDGVPIPGSLQNIFREVHDDTGRPVPASGRLERWVAQGVLSMNTIFTTRAFRSGSHRGRGWEEFSDAVIRRLNERRDHLVFLLWGAAAQQKAALIDPERHLVLTAAHPSPRRPTGGSSAAAISAAPTPTCARTASPKSNGDTMKPTKKKNGRLPRRTPARSHAPSRRRHPVATGGRLDGRSVERGTVGRSPPSTLSGTTASSAT